MRLYAAATLCLLTQPATPTNCSLCIWLYRCALCMHTFSLFPTNFANSNPTSKYSHFDFVITTSWTFSWCNLVYAVAVRVVLMSHLNVFVSFRHLALSLSTILSLFFDFDFTAIPNLSRREWECDFFFISFSSPIHCPLCVYECMCAFLSPYPFILEFLTL